MLKKGAGLWKTKIKFCYTMRAASSSRTLALLFRVIFSIDSGNVSQLYLGSPSSFHVLP
jgi:hypothetical protein